MHDFQVELEQLASQAGNPTRQAELRRLLEPVLVCMVQQTLQKGAGNGPMERCILAEARRLGPIANHKHNPEEISSSIARNLCAAFLAGLVRKYRFHQSFLETLKN